MHWEQTGHFQASGLSLVGTLLGVVFPFLMVLSLDLALAGVPLSGVLVPHLVGVALPHRGVLWPHLDVLADRALEANSGCLGERLGVCKMSPLCPPTTLRVWVCWSHGFGGVLSLAGGNRAT